MELVQTISLAIIAVAAFPFAFMVFVLGFTVLACVAIALVYLLLIITAAPFLWIRHWLRLRKARGG
jgi:hypothetical protein